MYQLRKNVRPDKSKKESLKMDEVKRGLCKMTCGIVRWSKSFSSMHMYMPEPAFKQPLTMYA